MVDGGPQGLVCILSAVGSSQTVQQERNRARLWFGEWIEVTRVAMGRPGRRLLQLSRRENHMTLSGNKDLHQGDSLPQMPAEHGAGGRSAKRSP